MKDNILTSARLLLLALLATASLPGRAAGGPHGFWHHNRLDRDGNRQGRWDLYYDDAQTKIQAKTRYRHGEAVGLWQRYALQGNRERRERYRRHGLISVREYHPNGQLWYRGQARIANEPDGLHYYWFGTWQVYSETGALEKVQTYENGKLVATRMP